MARGWSNDERWRGWRQDVAVATAIGIFLAAIGPYGSFLNGPLWQRLLFQLPCAWLGLGLIGIGVRLAHARYGRTPLFWASVALIAALAMGPVTLANIVLANILWPFLSHHMTPLKWYWEGLLIAVPASYGFAYLGLLRNDRATRRATVEEDTATRPMAGPLGARPEDVLCLQMEDHYVRVHVATGSHLVLATFGQAQEALANVRGLRVHRSWWVADAAITGAERFGRNIRLILRNGTRVPVARSVVAEARARGWLDAIG